VLTWKKKLQVKVKNRLKARMRIPFFPEGTGVLDSGDAEDAVVVEWDDKAASGVVKVSDLTPCLLKFCTST
jgi:hypothetical protein